MNNINYYITLIYIDTLITFYTTKKNTQFKNFIISDKCYNLLSNYSF